VQVDLRSGWSIREVEIPTRLVLAPMAGVSVQAFRRQGRRYGAGLVCSEMVSCAGLQHGNERTLGYLRISADERPLALLFIRETARELGGRRAAGFLKKFYGWYLGRGRFPRPFKQELVQLETVDEIEARLLAAALGAAEFPELLATEVPDGEDDVVLDLPISIYGGG
jgi:hypothetical protein